LKFTATLYNAAQAHTALIALWQQIKPYLVAEHRLVVTVEQETRTEAQNRLLHAWIGEIAKSMEWAGKKRDPEVWKRLLTAAWLRARGESIEVLPALDGHGIDVVFRHTSKLNKAECSELTEFVMAWASEHGVTSGADA
jgi:hypothetical protein